MLAAAARRHHLLLLGRGLTVPLRDRLVQELVNAVDHVSPDEREAAEAAAVHHTDRQWGTVHLLKRENVEACDQYHNTDFAVTQLL